MSEDILSPAEAIAVYRQIFSDECVFGACFPFWSRMEVVRPATFYR
jgi:hypothetical protein